MTSVMRCVLLLFLVGGALLDPIVFQDCGSEYDLDEVDIEGCSSIPCKLYTGEERRINIKLYSRHKSEKLHQDVEAVLFGFHIIMQVSPKDPCDAINCPIYNNGNASFSAIMDLRNEDIYPDMEGYLSWKMRNNRGQLVLCLEVPIYTADPVTRNDPIQ